MTAGIAPPEVAGIRLNRPRPIVVELAAVGAVAVYNVVSHRHVGRRARIATNVGAAGRARRAGPGRPASASAELGLEPADLRRGVRTGRARGGADRRRRRAPRSPIPRTRALLADEKITGTGRAEAAFETLRADPARDRDRGGDHLPGGPARARAPLPHAARRGRELLDLVRALARVPDARVAGPGDGGASRGRPATPRGRRDGRSGREHGRRRARCSRGCGCGRAASPPRCSRTRPSTWPRSRGCGSPVRR